MTKKELQKLFIEKLDGKRSASEISEVALELAPLVDSLEDLKLDDLYQSEIPDHIYGVIVSRLNKKESLPEAMARSVAFVLGKQAIEEQDSEKLKKSAVNRRRNQCSERVGIIVDPDIWSKVKETADFYNVSISSLVMDACRQYLNLN